MKTEGKMKKILLVTLFFAAVQATNAQGIVSLLQSVPDTIMATIKPETKVAMADEAQRFGTGHGQTELETEVEAVLVTAEMISYKIKDAAQFDFIMLPSAQKDVDSLICVVSTVNVDNSENARYIPLSTVKFYDREWNYIGRQTFSVNDFVNLEELDEDSRKIVSTAELIFFNVSYLPHLQSIKVECRFPINTSDETRQLVNVLKPVMLKWNGTRFVR